MPTADLITADLAFTIAFAPIRRKYAVARCSYLEVSKKPLEAAIGAPLGAYFVAVSRTISLINRNIR